MTILFIIAVAIVAIAVLVNVFTDVHPSVFYVAWLSALALMAIADAASGRWWWGFTADMALAVFATWAWRRDTQQRRRAAKA